MSFKKVLSFSDILWLGIGGMVGVAILTFPSMTYASAGPSSILSWLLAGVFSILMALIYAEMVTAFPKSGALVVFPYEAFGKGRLASYLAFLEGIGYYLGTLFGIVVSAIIIGNYISPWFSSGVGLILAGEIALLFVGVINLLGAKMTSNANKAMSIVFIAFFSLIIILALLHGNFSNLKPFVSGTSGAYGIVDSIAVAILAYGSWTAIIAVPEETRNVRSMAKAIIYSIIIVTVLYTLLVLSAYVGLTGAQLGANFEYPILALVATFHSAALNYAFEISAVLAILAVMLVMIMANARIVYALGKLNFLPHSMEKLSGSSIPLYATLLSFGIPMLLTLFPSQYYQYVIIGAIVGTGIPRIIDLAAYLKIRNKPSYKPQFRVKYGLPIAAIALIGLLISEIGISTNDVLWSVATFVLITLAFVLVERWRRKD